MLLINYDFYDIHRLICIVRSYPEEIDYIPMLNSIIEYIEKGKENNGIDSNAVRQLITLYIDKPITALGWAFVNNAYTYNAKIIKEESRYVLLVEVLKEIVSALREKNSDRAFMITDAVHNIPCALADDINPKKRIASEISEYRKRYNKDFLSSEIKNLQTRHRSRMRNYI